MSQLIDSDWVADFLKGRPAAVALLHRLWPSGIALSAVTVAEIYEGVLYGTDPRRDEESLGRFLGAVRILPVDRDVARRFAVIRGQLRGSGLLIGDADIFIAATAIQHHLTLVTRNIGHFQRIPGLALSQSI